jgi:hypothetical protein
MMQVLKDVGGVEMPELLARLTAEPQPGSAKTVTAAASPEAEGNGRRSPPTPPDAEA